MSLADNVAKVRALANLPEMVYSLPPSIKEHLIVAVDIVENHLGILERDEDINLRDDHTRAIQSSLDKCKWLLMNKPITDDLRELIGGHCVLVYNWNANVLKDERISNDVKFINNAIQMQYTMAHTLEIFKKVIDILDRKTTQERLTESISEHFLCALDELHEKEE